MKKLLAVALAASLLLNAALLLQRRRETTPETLVRTRVVERESSPSPSPEIESIPRPLPAPASGPAAPAPPAAPPTVSLLASPAYVAPGATITVTCVVSSGSTSAKQWIGLYSRKAHVTNHTDYRMVDSRSEPYVFQAPQKPGEYEFRYILEDNRTWVAASNPIQVPGEVLPAPQVQLRASESLVKCGGQIPALWTVLSGRRSSQDWIGLFPSDARNEDFTAWKYVEADGGVLTLRAPERPGSYELRYLLDNGYEVAAVSARILVVE